MGLCNEICVTLQGIRILLIFRVFASYCLLLYKLHLTDLTCNQIISDHLLTESQKLLRDRELVSTGYEPRSNNGSLSWFLYAGYDD